METNIMSRFTIINNSECPTFLKEDVFEKHFSLPQDTKEKVWKNLQRRETFTQGQVPPYRVEFESGLDEGAFYEKEKNIHHGPFLSVHGEIGKITDDYRGLHYYYGSYVLSFRLVRPITLEFRKTETGIQLTLISYVNPWFLPIWRKGNQFFWNHFGIQFMF